ncbi:MAG: hypothetical protein ACPLRN_01575 [Microgenomates group bacterium]
MTLTEISYYSRKLAPLLLLFFLIFLIIFYSFKLFFFYLEVNKPKVQIVPSLFGKIEAPYIKDATSSAFFSYILDTVEGKPVTTTDSAKVFFLDKPTTKFGYREKIYLMAKTFGFDTELVKHKLVDNQAVFYDGEKKLEINIANFNFKYETKPKTESLIDSGTFIPSEKVIENKAIDFLKKVGRYPDELATGLTKIIYIQYDPTLNVYNNVKSKKEANLVEVDFYRANIDIYPVVSPRFFNSQNFVIMEFDKDGNNQVIKAQIAFFEKSNSQFDIYPIKTAEVAWEEFQKGKGKVVAATYGQKQVVIKQIFLAYYDPDFYQSFLEPVYVFIGDNNFVGYLPAITSQYLIEN